VSERVVEDPVFRCRYVFRREAEENGGEVLHVEMWVDPGGGVTPHIHRSMEERFTVVAGEAEFLGGRKWQKAGPGETVVVPAGTRHAFRNRGGEVAHVMCEARPPSTLQEFLEDVAGLSRAGKLTRGGLPRGLGALLPTAVLAYHYREMVVLLMPPPFLQRLVVWPVARFGERRGHHAGAFAQLA
jgi:quercetin dioxygenase-like cupin family protein